MKDAKSVYFSGYLRRPLGFFRLRLVEIDRYFRVSLPPFIPHFSAKHPPEVLSRR